MRQAVELLGFLSVAAGLHLAAFALTAPRLGSDSGGAGGEAALSLTGAPGNVVAMVAEWDRAPEATTDPVPAPQAEPLPEVPVVSMPAADAALPRALPEPVARITPDAAPDLRTAPDMRRPLPRPPRPVAPAADKATPAAPAQTARGAAGTQAAGVAIQPTRPSLTSGERQALMSAWGGRIRAKVERRKRSIRGAGGRVTVELTVTRAGALQSVRVAKSSGDARLDREAVDAVRRARSFPPAPDKLSGAEFPFRLPIRFKP